MPGPTRGSGIEGGRPSLEGGSRLGGEVWSGGGQVVQRLEGDLSLPGKNEPGMETRDRVVPSARPWRRRDSAMRDTSGVEAVQQLEDVSLPGNEPGMETCDRVRTFCTALATDRMRSPFALRVSCSFVSASDNQDDRSFMSQWNLRHCSTAWLHRLKQKSNPRKKSFFFFFF